MSATEDISWQELRRITREWAGDAAELDEVKPLVGGAINTTLALHTTAGDRAVLKISPHRVDRSYEREAEQLKLLKQIGLPVPDVYVTKTGTLDQPFSYIIIEFIEGMDLSAARRACDAEQFDRLQERLAEMVATLHDQRGETYCRVAGGNQEQFGSWPAFYRHVYDVIWHEAEKSPLLTSKCRKQIGKVHERLDRLVAHTDGPRLVHWDIWATNLLVKPDEKGEWQITGLLDPNCKYAHAEAEIAYMELFHTINHAFSKAYQKRHRLPSEYHQYRKVVYQLYPLLNHLNLFGQEYVKPLMAQVEKVSAIV